MYSNPSFSQWIKQRRRLLDLTQAELADRIGCSPSTLQKFEEETRRPSKQMAELLAIHLEIPANEKESFLRAARKGENEPLPVVTQPITTPETTIAHNLPLPPTPLIGRSDDIRSIHDLLAAENVRLVTIVGTPGVGKTRLSLELSHQLVTTAPARFIDGVWFVPLAAIRQTDLLLSSISYALALHEQGTLPIVVQLVQHLRDKRILLVLDNFEQIIEAAPDLSELLAHCPHLKLLITSRTPLLLRNEYQHTLAPFAIPSLTKVNASLFLLADIQEFSAVQLFVNTVQRFDPSFRLTPVNATTILKICSRLDGMALAIELAAARLRQFNVDALLTHLQRSTSGALALLIDGARDLPARHRTLHNAIAWSYDLLDGEAQRIFAICGVFVGGFTYEALSYVDGEDNADNHHVGLLNTLQTLIEHSLLAKEEQADEQTRYLMLETIGEFALRQVQASGAEQDIRQRHAHYFGGLAETAYQQKQSKEKTLWLNRLSSNLDNLYQAFQWFLTYESDQALALAGAMKEFWYLRGYFHQGRQWLTQAFALAQPNTPTPAYARALLAAGQLANHQGESVIALSLVQASIDCYRQIGDTWGTAEAMRECGWVTNSLAQHDATIAHFEESLQLFRLIGDTGKIADLLVSLVYARGIQQLGYQQTVSYLQESLTLLRTVNDFTGILFALQLQGEAGLRFEHYEEATKTFQEGFELARSNGAKRYMLWNLLGLSEAKQYQGDPEGAIQQAQVAMQLCQELGQKDGLLNAWLRLGDANRMLGDYEAAMHYYQAGLKLCRELNQNNFKAHCLLGCAGIAISKGNVRHATYILGSAQKMLDHLPPFLAPIVQREFSQWVASARHALGETVFEQAWNEGLTAETEQVMSDLIQN